MEANELLKVIESQLIEFSNEKKVVVKGLHAYPNIADMVGVGEKIISYDIEIILSKRK